ncbi:hypothetical protein VTN02DRAFT_1956 [Thermoascus thermophilus]
MILRAARRQQPHVRPQELELDSGADKAPADRKHCAVASVLVSERPRDRVRVSNKGYLSVNRTLSSRSYHGLRCGNTDHPTWTHLRVTVEVANNNHGQRQARHIDSSGPVLREALIPSDCAVVSNRYMSQKICRYMYKNSNNQRWPNRVGLSNIS